MSKKIDGVNKIKGRNIDKMRKVVLSSIKKEESKMKKHEGGEKQEKKRFLDGILFNKKHKKVEETEKKEVQAKIDIGKLENKDIKPDKTPPAEVKVVENKKLDNVDAIEKKENNKEKEENNIEKKENNKEREVFEIEDKSKNQKDEKENLSNDSSQDETKEVHNETEMDDVNEKKKQDFVDIKQESEPAKKDDDVNMMGNETNKDFLNEDVVEDKSEKLLVDGEEISEKEENKEVVEKQKKILKKKNFFLKLELGKIKKRYEQIKKEKHKKKKKQKALKLKKAVERKKKIENFKKNINKKLKNLSLKSFDFSDIFSKRILLLMVKISLAVIFVFAILYLFFSFVLFRFQVDNKISRKLADCVYVPAIISKAGNVEFYEYLDLFKAMEGVYENRTEAKEATTNHFVKMKAFKRLSEMYGFDMESQDLETLEEKINEDMVKDKEINRISYERVEKIKKGLEDGEDFDELGRKYGSINNNKENRDFLLNLDAFQNLSDGEISEVFVGKIGYYLIKRENNSFKYLFVRAYNFDDYLEFFEKKIKVLNLVK